MRCVDSNIKPQYEEVFESIADYILETPVHSELAFETARLCLIDAMGCAIKALDFPVCTKLLGPIVEGATLKDGVPIPGTLFKLDPVQAAFNLGLLIRWLDFNDTWLAKEWGHPSDNLGAILALAYYVSRLRNAEGKSGLVMQDVLLAMIKAYEIQGIFALQNSFNAVGLDHVILVKLASVAVGAWLLGCDRDALLRALSQVFVDGQSLRTYRHAPNTGSRKSWAAGDATSRAVWLLLMTQKGEMGYPSALSAQKWGFYDVSFEKKPFLLNEPFGSYVIENILWKLSYPAEFHAQTAVESAVFLHSEVIQKLDFIEKIELITHSAAIRIISKEGPLHNPADRDHCLQYMVAVALLYGTLNAEHYEDEVAKDPRIDALRHKMVVQENRQFSLDYLDKNKRSIANTVRIFLKDGKAPLEKTVEYPIGHVSRRDEGCALLIEKFKKNVKNCIGVAKTESLLSGMQTVEALGKTQVVTWMEMWQSRV